MYVCINQRVLCFVLSFFLGHRKHQVLEPPGPWVMLRPGFCGATLLGFNH